MKTNILGLPVKESELIVGQLNVLLSNFQVYYQNLRGIHWNIRGKRFFDLHVKFEELYTDAQIKIDSSILEFMIPTSDSLSPLSCTFGKDFVSRVLVFVRRLLAFAYRHSLKRLFLFVSYQIGGLLLVGNNTRLRINQIYNRLSPRQVLWFCKV
ncbi:MAG: hypothetical protein U0945_08345, partial [Flavobacterium sp.]|nr:hypothetical protein [Flavobacterium sp.]